MVIASVGVFLDFQLPNATTWFYFSWLLAIALFFKFSRVLSIRNHDIVTLFLLTPGILLIQSSRPNTQPDPKELATLTATLICQPSPGSVPNLTSLTAVKEHQVSISDAQRTIWIGYLWLLCGTGYLFLRCLYDLTLRQRPAIAANLNFGGMAWLSLTLMACLFAVAFRQQVRPALNLPPLPQVQNGKSEALGPNAPPIGKEGAVLSEARRRFQPPPWLVSSFSIMCHLAVVLGMMVIGRRHFQDLEAGLAAATCYLLLPSTGFFVGQLHHVGPVTLIVWAIALYPRPFVAGVLLGIASGAAYFPALLLPVWLSFYGRRGAGRFMLGFLLMVALSLGVLLLYWYLTGDLSSVWRATLADTGWQPWKVPGNEGFWTGVHWAYRIPVFLGFMVFLIATMFWPRNKNLADLLGLSTAVLMGVQFWYADQGGLYVLWYSPLMMLLIFRPNLQDRFAPEIPTETDWLARSRRGLIRWFRRSAPTENLAIKS